MDVFPFKVILGEYDQLGKEFFPPDSYLAIDVIRHPFYRKIAVSYLS